MFASKTRSILKTLSWRIVGTLDTMFLGWVITGDPTVGLKIGALELVTKFVLYYFHEKLYLSSTPIQTKAAKKSAYRATSRLYAL